MLTFTWEFPFWIHDIMIMILIYAYYMNDMYA